MVLCQFSRKSRLCCPIDLRSLCRAVRGLIINPVEFDGVAFTLNNKKNRNFNVAFKRFPVLPMRVDVGWLSSRYNVSPVWGM